jgi:hypothetical protein
MLFRIFVITVLVAIVVVLYKHVSETYYDDEEAPTKVDLVKSAIV